MGWDAFTKIERGENKLINDQLDIAFKNAASFVKKKTGRVDPELHLGMLDNSCCAHFLYKATGVSVYDQEGWSINKVHLIRKKANWNFEFDKEFSWAYWSAKKFLEVCARKNLAIYFSY